LLSAPLAAPPVRRGRVESPAVNDDWRLRIDAHDDRDARDLTHALEEHAGEPSGFGSIDDRVIVTHDGSEVFCYAATREQAEQTQKEIESLASGTEWKLDFELRHWHPTAEEWEDPDTPLPENDAQMAAERRERIEQERADSAEDGYPDFEVRIHCRSHRAANELAERLEAEGVPFTHRWSTVLVGATDEDSAAQLAERMRAEAPDGSEVSVEGNLRSVYNERPGRRFWLLGGLGG
jgi:hypothetical protein